MCKFFVKYAVNDLSENYSQVSTRNYRENIEMSTGVLPNMNEMRH